jgi:hypothetical protein
MKFNLNAKSPTLKVDKDELKSWLLFGLVVLFGAFCLYSSKTLLSKALYQQKVVSASNKAVKQLDANLTGAAQLSSQYKGLFENDSPINVLGGKNDSSAGAVPPNVDNARIALDALPITYDYPALIASLTKILTDNGISAPTITGTDATATTPSDPSASPQPVMITVSISGSGSSSSVQNVLNSLEKSIRPFDVTSLQLSGSGSQLDLTASLNSYFQPAKTLGITRGSIR